MSSSSCLVLIAGLLALCPALRAVTSNPAKHEQIKWAMAQLESVDWGDRSTVKNYVRELRGKLRQISEKTGPWAKPQFIAEELTVHNPAYWRAILAMGEDRVLLFWLHALLLETQQRPIAAFEWAVMARRGVILERDFDVRWLQWERALMLHTPAGKPYRRDVRDRDYLFVPTAEGIFGFSSGGGPVLIRALTTPGLLESEEKETPVLMAFRKVVWNRWWIQYQEETLPAAMREVVRNRGQDWPNFPPLAFDELAIVAHWMVTQGRHALAVMCWINAAQQTEGVARFRYDTFLKPLVGDSLRTDLSVFCRDTSRLGLAVDVRTFTGQNPRLHPWLRWDAQQLERRMRTFKPNRERWGIGDYWYYAVLARTATYAGDWETARRMIGRLPRDEFGRNLREYELLRLARLSSDSALLRRQIEAQLKKNKSRETHPHLSGAVAVAQKNWAVLQESFERLIQKEEISADRRVHFVFHARVAARLAGRSTGEVAEIGIPEDLESPWGRILAEAILFQPDRGALLKMSKTATRYETAAHRAEAHLALAFSPEATPETRRADLEAVLATGRVDFIEYDIARYALRDMDAESSAAYTILTP